MTKNKALQKIKSGYPGIYWIVRVKPKQWLIVSELLKPLFKECVWESYELKPISKHFGSPRKLYRNS